MNISHLVGNTPIIKLQSLTKNLYADIYIKLEFLNPWGSIKDRAAKSMIDAAIADGSIQRNTTIVEATTGNTGISLAGICASMGLPLIIVMPEYVTEERKKLLELLGAQIELTPAELNYQGAVSRAIELASQENYFLVDQGNNQNNPFAHVQTAREIIDFFDGTPDIFIAGVGTGGHCNGIGNTLKQHNHQTKVIAIEPKGAAVLSGRTSFSEVNSNHGVLGIGPGIIAKTVDREVIDEVYVIEGDDAITMTRKVICEEGLLLGISSGASIHCALELAARKENAGKKILTIAASQTERYLSTGI
ncbi:cysteine synthase family protein [Photobacterium sp. 2_MG-2023]|uniref:cysteine synthase n=1 Tax=Photobacterium arenosum TaxID=2774143 RepID=A0ABR9BHC6_9GAMM|nr:MULTISPECIES: cysteine synthase family protein [Photobacterium]MBD8511579.1 cysteine synthase family protein [Photobacterium arenosum]MBV7264154.1 cysteine synthase family protein [Photobacterium sp. WH24]MDO6583107.1 cysteine synthase family protein [Photobacterium sp. 2_MG-2023]